MPKTRPTRPATARAVLGPVLRDRVAAFRAREALVRLDEPGSVHRFLVSARRLRSLTGVFGTILSPTACAALEVGLRDAAGTLANAHDARVVQRRLESLLSSEGGSPAVEETRIQVGYLLERSYQDSWRQAISHFDSPGYDAFTRALDMFADLPPWTPLADAPADKVFVPVLRREWASLLRIGRDVQELEPGAERDRRLDAVQAAARRAKDVAEAQGAIAGRKVERLRRATRGLTAPLEEYHDVVVTGAVLSSPGADLPGADSVIPRLRAREAKAAGELYKEFVRGFREADRKSLRSWMS